MARRKMEQLRDAVISAAYAWSDDRNRPLNWPHDSIGHCNALETALADLRQYITPIIDSPGEYVEGSPETSRNAALAFLPLSGSVRRKIVDEIWSVQFWHPGHGLSDADLEHRLKGRHQTVSSARNWLVNAGWIHDSGLRKMSPSKRPQVVWTLTDAAECKMRENA